MDRSVNRLGGTLRVDLGVQRGKRFGRSPCAVGRGVVDDRDPPRERQRRAQVVVQAADAAVKDVLLVVDGRRWPRRRASGDGVQQVSGVPILPASATPAARALACRSCAPSSNHLAVASRSTRNRVAAPRHAPSCPRPSSSTRHHFLTVRRAVTAGAHRRCRVRRRTRRPGRGRVDLTWRARARGAS